MRFNMNMKMSKAKGQMSKVHVKCKMFSAFAVIAGLLVILAACGKVEENRPAKAPAPFSRGPSGPPKISAPTYLPPSN